MRLLNVYDLHFKEFYDSNIPAYAILSHRWGDEEVSFKEMRKSNGGGGREGKGWEKIRSTCRLAEREGFHWVWVDTCCINKDSSAELTEAINSMFKWYAKSGRCYVYLSDFRYVGTLTSHFHAKELGQSSWFSHGWTLQELLAPGEMCFYDKDWRRIGSKGDMIPLLAEITNIEPQYLEHQGWQDACVAQKMSWASGRQTSRIEDVAYSLLGLFDVNMPLLYGEGRKAFYRLQLEIIKQSDDESIFAWITKRQSISHTGLLAPWPDAFSNSRNIRLREHDVARSPYTMTNKGLEIVLRRCYIREDSNASLTLWQQPKDPKANLLTHHLNCGNTRVNTIVEIKLERRGFCWYRKADHMSSNREDTEKGKYPAHCVKDLQSNWERHFEDNIKIRVRQEERQEDIQTS